MALDRQAALGAEIQLQPFIDIAQADPVFPRRGRLAQPREQLLQGVIIHAAAVIGNRQLQSTTISVDADGDAGRSCSTSRKP